MSKEIKVWLHHDVKVMECPENLEQLYEKVASTFKVEKDALKEKEVCYFDEDKDKILISSDDDFKYFFENFVKKNENPVKLFFKRKGGKCHGEKRKCHGEMKCCWMKKCHKPKEESNEEIEEIIKQTDTTGEGYINYKDMVKLILTK